MGFHESFMNEMQKAAGLPRFLRDLVRSGKGTLDDAHSLENVVRRLQLAREGVTLADDMPLSLTRAIHNEPPGSVEPSLNMKRLARSIGKRFPSIGISIK
jgi:hypothetical protein